MLRLGVISELGEGNNLGYARVSFDERGFVSGWLSLPSSGTKDTKHWIPVAVNSQVACLMDERCEQGGIVMVLWSAGDTPPPWAGPATRGILFPDGTEIFYDSDGHTLTVNAPGAELNLTCKKLNVTGEVNITGNTNVTGEIVATVEVTAGARKIALTKHKHPTPNGVSGPPTP